MAPARRRSVRAFAPLVAWLAATNALALDPARALTQYVQTVWRMEEGLPHNAVRAVRQTPDGYLWLGTHAGLVRFDGVRFLTFDNRNSGLRDNEVRALAVDRRGVLWIGTAAGGLHRLTGRGAVEPFDHGVDLRTINALAVSESGSVWAGASGGLYRVDPRGDAWSVDSIAGLERETVQAVAPGADHVWVGTEAGLWRVDGDRAAPVVSSAVPKEGVLALHTDSKGRLWLGQMTGVVAAQPGRSGDLRDARRWPIPPAWGGTWAFLEDRRGTLWIGTYGGGLYRLRGDRVEGFSRDSGFLDHRAWALLEDREGSLWVGTRGGLAQLRDGPVVTYSTQEGLPGDVARAVWAAPDGAVWIGTEGGLSEYREGRLRHFTQDSGLPGVTVRSFLRDRSGRLWMGTDHGIVEFDPRRGRVVRVIDRARGLPTNEIRVMHEDRSGRLWVGTTAGVAVADRGADDRFRIPEGMGLLSAQRVETFFEDRDGGLWIGGLPGALVRWKDGVVTRPTLLQGASLGVRSIYEDENGVLYFGTVGGGLFVRHGDGAFARITTQQGLVDDGIWSLLPDGESLWMSSDRGVFRVSRASLLAVASGAATRIEVQDVVGTAEGMKSRECNGGGGFPAARALDGRLWYPTTLGAAALDPRALGSSGEVPVRIEEVVIDRAISAPSDAVIVPQGARDVEIHYTGLSYVDPKRLRFRYRLEGYHAEWIEAGERRVAFLSNVPPGSYTFRVEAATTVGRFEGRGADLAVVIEPRPLERFSVRVAAAGLLVSAVGLAAWWRGKRLRARQAELERLVATRTAELEDANARLARLVTVDDLTEIANHRRFSEVLREEWARCHRSLEPLSLLLCDIDDFKAYNDTYGHQAGDECLRRVARAIDGAVQRAPDLAARYGGEEFVIVLPSTGRDGAVAVAEAIRRAVAALDIPHSASRATGRVTVSIGCATAAPAPDSPETPETLIAAADRALYEAKNSGRDRLVHAS